MIADRSPGREVSALSVPPAKPRRLPWRLLLSLAIIAAVLAYVLKRAHLDQVGDALGDVDLAVMVAVPAVSLLMALPLALRERAILGALGRPATLLQLAPVTFYGNTASLITPAASGEVLRPRLLQRILGLPFTSCVAVVLYARLFSIAMYLIAAGFALVASLASSEAVRLLAVPAFALCALVLPPLALTGQRVWDRLPLRERVIGLVQRFLGANIGTSMRESAAVMTGLAASPRLTVTFALWTTAVYLLLGAQFWLLADAVAPEVSFAEAWAVLTVSTVAGMASGLPLGVGATDAVMLTLLTSYGASDPAAAAVIILYRGLVYLPTALMGIAAYFIADRQGRVAEARDGGNATA